MGRSPGGILRAMGGVSENRVLEANELTLGTPIGMFAWILVKALVMQDLPL